LDDAVDAKEGDFFPEAAGPDDFDFVDFGGGAEAEVEAEVGGGSVAAAAKDVGALANAARGEEDFGADGVAGTPKGVTFRGRSPTATGGVCTGA